MAKKQFKAESKRLLDLMIHSIYTNREIFLRELISNASDALDKLHYLSLTDEAVRAKCGELHIFISPDKEARTLTITDNGIGMTAEELEHNLGTIAKSGSLQFKESIDTSDEEAVSNIIGQFGVGFYSAFMVSNEVTVRTRSTITDEANCWISTGADGYTIKPCDKETYGTDIILKLKADTKQDSYSEYLEPYRLQHLIKTYSDYIRYPIRMELEKTRTVGEGEDQKTETYKEVETVNSMVPIWKRAKNEVSEEECRTYYKQKFFDSADPLYTIRISTEGVVSYQAMLFVPARAPYDFYTKDFKKGLQLYSSGVLIMEQCADLLPDHFRFVRGIVDSQDLSLNISREMLQQDHQLKAIAQNIEKKILSELKKGLANDRETYEKFFDAFGLQLKYGVVSDYGMHKDKLKDLLLFYSASQQKRITLEEYITAMPEDQKYIYYACGETVQKIGALPQAELVKDKGYDMLCLTDEVDEFVMQMLGEISGKTARSIKDDNAELQSDDTKEKIETAAEENKELLAFLKETLGERVHDVKLSQKLKSHPVCLSATGGITFEMEKYFAAMPGNEMKPKAQRVLELNAEHPVFEALKRAYASDRERAKTLGEILYDQALLIADLPLDDPAHYTELVCSLMQ